MRLCHHRIKIHQLMFLACVLIPCHIAKVTMPWQAAKFKSTHMVNGGGGDPGNTRVLRLLSSLWKF